MEESIKFGIVASAQHPQVDYSKVNYSKAPYSAQPWNTITYAECHDNHVLWDKLAISAKNATEEERKEMYKLALSIVLTSQGISFLHAGTEFLRTKKGVENSFESPDTINAIDWNLKTKNKEMFEFVKGLVKMREKHPAFRMKDSVGIKENIQFLDRGQKDLVVYLINGQKVNDQWKKILVILNGGKKRTIGVPAAGQWKTAIWDNRFDMTNVESSSFLIEPFSCSILYQD